MSAGPVVLRLRLDRQQLALLKRLVQERAGGAERLDHLVAVAVRACHERLGPGDARGRT